MNFLSLENASRFGNGFPRKGFFAVMAFEFDCAAVLAYLEAAGNGLAVADAVGIGAAEYFANGFRQP